MELALLIVGVAAAVVVGVAWALHRHDLAEGADKVSSYALATTFGLALLEAWNEWGDWSKDFYISGGTFGPDGKYHATPRPSHPDAWRQAEHIGGQLLVEVARDLLISGAVFGLLFLILRASRGRGAGAV